MCCVSGVCCVCRVCCVCCVCRFLYSPCNTISDVTLGYILIDTCGLVERTVKSFVDIIAFNITAVIGQNTHWRNTFLVLL